MPLMPKRVKYRKSHRAKSKPGGLAYRGVKVSFGEYGLQALGEAWISNTQIEACRVAVNRAMKRKGKLWIRIFPDRPYTKKPLETRMGKGKGSVEYWYAVVKPGRMLFEVDGISEVVARKAFRAATMKLPIQARFVVRKHR